MTLSELDERYYFHDSTLEKLEYSDGELKLYVRFCDFMQENYDDRMIQIAILSLYFKTQGIKRMETGRFATLVFCIKK